MSEVPKNIPESDSKSESQTETPAKYNPSPSVGGSMAARFLAESVDKGNRVEIPSLGITLNVRKDVVSDVTPEREADHSNETSEVPAKFPRTIAGDIAAMALRDSYDKGNAITIMGEPKIIIQKGKPNIIIHSEPKSNVDER